jgi:hypothetical protein
VSDETLKAAAKADPGPRHWLRITIEEITYTAHSSSPFVVLNLHDERNSGCGNVTVSGNALALMLGSDFKLGDELVLATKTAKQAPEGAHSPIYSCDKQTENKMCFADADGDKPLCGGRPLAITNLRNAVSCLDCQTLLTQRAYDKALAEGRLSQGFGSTIGKAEADKSLYNPRQEHKT